VKFIEMINSTNLTIPPAPIDFAEASATENVLLRETVACLGKENDL
jgi:hypothetical protein